MTSNTLEELSLGTHIFWIKPKVEESRFEKAQKFLSTSWFGKGIRVLPSCYNFLIRDYFLAVPAAATAVALACKQRLLVDALVSVGCFAGSILYKDLAPGTTIAKVALATSSLIALAKLQSDYSHLYDWRQLVGLLHIGIDLCNALKLGQTLLDSSTNRLEAAKKET